MEGTFIEWLNSIHPAIPIALAIVVVIGGFLAASYKKIAGFKNWYDHRKEEKFKKDEEERLFRSRMNGFFTDFERLNSKVDDLALDQKQSNETSNKKIEELNEYVKNEGERSRQGDEKLAKRLEQHETNMNSVFQKIDGISEVMDLLVESDKDDISSFITDEYYKCIKQGYVEIYKLKVIESRYQSYLKENGDSFIEGLMNEIRSLPKTPSSKVTTSNLKAVKK